MSEEEMFFEFLQQYIEEGNFPDYSGEYPNPYELTIEDSILILNVKEKHNKEIERLHSIIKEVREDLHQVVKWCTENKHNEDTTERYLVVDYGTIVGKINEIRTKLDQVKEI